MTRYMTSSKRVANIKPVPIRCYVLTKLRSKFWQIRLVITSLVAYIINSVTGIYFGLLQKILRNYVLIVFKF